MHASTIISPCAFPVCVDNLKPMAKLQSSDQEAYGTILRECANIADERQTQYGDVKRNFQETADIHNAMFGLPV